MSVQAINWAWEQPIPRNLLPELLALADNANDYGIAWVRVATLAAKTKTTERTVQRNIGELVKAGALEVIERRMPGSGNRCNLYLLKMPGVDRSAQQDYIDELTAGAIAVTRGGDAHVTQGVTPTTPRGDASDTHNHKNDPSLKGYSNKAHAEKPAKKEKPKGRHRLPDDWTIPETVLAKLLEQDYDAAHIQEQAESFKLYWQERKDEVARKASWGTAFLNWMKRAGKEKAAPFGTASQYQPNQGHYHAKRQANATGAGILGQIADRKLHQTAEPDPGNDYIEGEFSHD